VLKVPAELCSAGLCQGELKARCPLERSRAWCCELHVLVKHGKWAHMPAQTRVQRQRPTDLCQPSRSRMGGGWAELWVLSLRCNVTRIVWASSALMGMFRQMENSTKDKRNSTRAHKLQHDPHKMSSAALGRNAPNPAVALLVVLRFCIGCILEDIVLEESVILNAPCMVYCALYLGLGEPVCY